MRRRGLTLLLEVILGLALFLMAILFLFRLFPAADASVSQSDRLNQATQLARRLLEEKLARRYDNLPLGLTTGSQTVQHATRRGTVQETQFAYQVDVEQVQPTLKTVTVNVTWQIGILQRQVTLQTQKGSMW